MHIPWLYNMINIIPIPLTPHSFSKHLWKCKVMYHFTLPLHILLALTHLPYFSEIHRKITGDLQGPLYVWRKNIQIVCNPQQNIVHKQGVFEELFFLIRRYFHLSTLKRPLKYTGATYIPSWPWLLGCNNKHGFILLNSFHHCQHSFLLTV